MSGRAASDNRFWLDEAGIGVRFAGVEVHLLRDALAILEGLGTPEDDPGAARLSPPAYLGDAEADSEWRRFAGTELDSARRADRSAVDLLLDAVETGGALDDRVGTTVASALEAAAFLRVVNEMRLVLAARWGIDTAEDYDALRPEAGDVLNFLGWIITDLTDVLSETLDRQ